MDTAEIPDDVRRFLLQQIDSVAKLEALLLMRKQAAQAWDAPLLAKRLYISAAQASAILADLTRLGFCQPVAEQSAAYRYAPAEAHLHEIAGRVAEVYARQLIPVTNLIHSRSAGASSAQRFADAFKVFKKEDG